MTMKTFSKESIFADAEAIPGVDPRADENLLRQSLGA